LNKHDASTIHSLFGSQKNNRRGEMPRLLEKSNLKLGSTTTARYTSKSRKRKRAFSRNITKGSFFSGGECGAN
jgi:hypothetical protein